MDTQIGYFHELLIGRHDPSRLPAQARWAGRGFTESCVDWVCWQMLTASSGGHSGDENAEESQARVWRWRARTEWILRIHTDPYFPGRMERICVTLVVGLNSVQERAEGKPGLGSQFCCYIPSSLLATAISVKWGKKWGLDELLAMGSDC